ncbi:MULTISPECIES: rhomboid family intramembrane serine protease [Cellulosimicrobium]|uniref:rhomboid family intramembrane serine protease n=1 Tax=Cellulosimicrobium TaxID=157920 RepID=UPI001E60621A|nr:rhomboid family intramembrane serine protease [Cellulosimicrobium sp. JZ28]
MSYVRCQRCGRPACPECQRPAAVGVQCVDCVRDAARQAPTQRTALGGKVRGGPPVVTFTIIGLCVVSWLLQLVTGGTWTNMLAFAPWVGELQPYRFLTAAFLHSTSPVHILFNMYALWITGPFLEQQLGRLRFTALYLLSALGGSVGYLLLAGGPTSEAWYQPVVGASGAVFGLFGAILLVLRRTGRNAMQIVVLIGINFAIGLFFPGIAWQAHLGGLVVGLALGAAYAYAPRERRTLVSVGATVVVVVALVAASWLTYAAADQFGHLA